MQDKIEQVIEQIRERLTCRSGFGHYCPNCDNTFGPDLLAELSALLRRRSGETEGVFKAGWRSGYYDGGEHDCRMFTPTADRAWDHYQREQAKDSGDLPTPDTNRSEGR